MTFAEQQLMLTLQGLATSDDVMTRADCGDQVKISELDADEVEMSNPNQSE